MQLYLSWLCYFYLALSLRENVLMVNGSHIKGWWIQVRIRTLAANSSPSNQLSTYSFPPFYVATVNRLAAPLLELGLLAADAGLAGVQPR